MSAPLRWAEHFPASIWKPCGDVLLLFFTNEETEAQRGQVTGVESYGLTVAQLKLDPGLPIPSPVLFLPLNSHFTTSLE